MAVEFLETLEVTPLNDPTSWLGFRVRYETEKGRSMGSSLVVWKSAANQFEKIVAPVAMSDVTKATISQYESGLREQGRKEATIATYLRAIRAALNWAEYIELIRVAPKVRIPKQTGRRSRGRAITGEEFDRWLEAMKTIVGEDRYPSWEHLLRGLNLSGFRLGESLELWWDRDDKIMPINLDGRRPLVSFPWDKHKGKREEVCAIAPDFAAFLRETPADQRTGPVFRPIGREGEVRSRDYVGRTISAAGRAAKIVVSRDNEKPSFATAHDLRRTFGTRWAFKVMPSVLMDLMRHRDLATSMAFYVGHSAERTSNLLWEMQAAGDSSG